MTKTIELDADEEKLLHEAAQRRGVTPEDYLRATWRELAELDAAEDGKTANDE